VVRASPRQSIAQEYEDDLIQSLAVIHKFSDQMAAIRD
jgi:hypothetical protein